MKNVASQVVLTTDSSSGDETETDEDQDLDNSVNVSTPVSTSATYTPKRARINIMSPGVAAALDRTRLSSRNAAYVLSEVTSSLGLGHDISDFNINRNSIHRARASHRASMASNLRSEFAPSVPLTVHWDGKLMQDLTSHEHVDRLPVLISGVGVEQLLGVPKLPSGTGEAQASAVVNSLGEWGVADEVCALCFDTTASNTGHRSGACALIEQKLDRDLLYMACRHHVMELVVGAAFEKTVGSAGASTGPDILLFKRFKEQWPYIDRASFKPAASDPAVETLVAASRQDILVFQIYLLTFT